MSISLKTHRDAKRKRFIERETYKHWLDRQQAAILEDLAPFIGRRLGWCYRSHIRKQGSKITLWGRRGGVSIRCNKIAEREWFEVFDEGSTFFGNAYEPPRERHFTELEPALSYMGGLLAAYI